MQWDYPVELRGAVPENLPRLPGWIGESQLSPVLCEMLDSSVAVKALERLLEQARRGGLVRCVGFPSEDPVAAGPGCRAAIGQGRGGCGCDRSIDHVHI